MVRQTSEIKIEPFKLERILDLKISKNINEHSKLYFKAILDEEENEKVVEYTEAETEIKVEIIEKDEKDEKDKKNKIIFIGIISKTEVKQEGFLYEIEVEAMSYSVKMDIKRKNRSFQNKSIPYLELLRNISREYEGDVIDNLSNGKELGNFTMQYEETDWEFIKRLASRFNGGLVCADTQNKPKYFFGIPIATDTSDLNRFDYKAKKDLLSYMKSKENTNPALINLDKFEYEVETGEFFEIGDSVIYRKVNFYINSVKTITVGSEIKNIYSLKTKKGLSQNKIFNNKIKGVSINGKVLEVVKDQIKVHLEIDKEQDKNTAHKFKYTTNYTSERNSGFYFMPEINDTVCIYFKSSKEEEAIGLNSIRTQNSSQDKINDPNVKYIRTANGKEIKFDKDEILITTEDDTTFIRLNDKTGIEIRSNLSINIVSQADLNIESGKKIFIQAKEEINLECKSSKIKMNNNVEIYGKEIKNN